MTEQTDVVVVGAGLAGLVCAAQLERSGLEVRLLEATDEVGGRVRTQEIDGHLCDVGFQLLNPAYPAVQDLVDVDALGLQPFAAGVRVRRGDGSARLGDPRREPGLLAATLRSGLISPREIVGLTRWAAPVLRGEQRILRGDDVSLDRSLDAAGVDGPLRRHVLEPFLAGVLADDSGATSTRVARLLVRYFLLGTPALPRDGMRALPAQLAAGLRRPVETGVRVHGIDSTSTGTSVRTSVGPVAARAVVVATDAQDAGDLAGLTDTRPMSGLTTWWFSTPVGLPTDRLLVVDGDRGPVVNTAVVSAAAPSYAPDGRELVQVTALADTALTDAEALVEAGRLWQTGTSGWDLLVRHDVTRALPRTTAPFAAAPATSGTDGVFVAGDHRDTPSIQGAMASGRRAADAVVRTSSGRRPRSTEPR